MSVQLPQYANSVNYLAFGIMPPNFSYQQQIKLRTDTRVYIWDDPLLFRRGAYQIIKRCVPEDKQGGIIDKCHASPYGGHFVGERTVQKILLSGFYWPTIFKDCYEWVKHYDIC